ncbi:MAG: hypothetical protein K6F30_05945 [Lachnospiraceae bacterium]|nr:hypothetical protein [Lachnospiraceae bacterium]
MILYTLDKKEIEKSMVGNFCFGLFLALFGAIYEVFSHQVYSYFMIYAFAIPMVFGTGGLYLVNRFAKKIPTGISLSAWNMAIATLSIGFVFKGVIDIYGSTNKLLIGYPIATVMLVVFSIISYIKQEEPKKQSAIDEECYN